MDASPTQLSLVIPVFNEEENIPLLLAEIRAALDPLPLAYEVLWVDDGSTDASPAVLRGLAAGDPRLRVIRLRRNSGQSAALGSGFRAARGETIVTLDADLQNDPADIPLLLAELERSGVDLVCGVRAKRQDDWVRRASSRIANRIRNRLTHENITDTGCTLKAFRAEFLRPLPMFTGMHRFLPTLVRLEGARVKEIPVHHRPRLHGQPKYNISNRIWRALADLFAVRWMQKRWIDWRLAEEIRDWNTTPYGSPSDSSDRPFSLAASSSSGSPPSAASRA